MGTWIGSSVYSGYILLTDINLARRERHANGHRYTVAIFLQNRRALSVEFGVAELVGLLVIRPALRLYFSFSSRCH